MTCSPARLAANRRNAQRSTGPKTARGREISRQNALKHGMTGAGVVLPEGEAAEVDALAAEFAAEMKPTGPMGRMLLRRVAVFSARLDRCGRHDAAMTAKRVRDAQRARDAARRAEVNDLAAILGTDPDRAVTRMMEMPEGIDGLIEAWQVLQGQLARPGKLVWADGDDHRVDHLLGRHPGIHPPTQFDPFLRAIRGDFSGLGADQGAGLHPKGRKAWAREQLAALIDAEVEALRELRVLIDDEDEAADRAEAGDRALFDPSKEAQLARKYEAAAERALFRTLREFHQVEQRAESVAATEPEARPTAAPPRRETSEPRPRPAKTQARLAPAPVSRPTPAKTNPTIGVGTSAPAAPHRPANPPTTGPMLV